MAEIRVPPNFQLMITPRKLELQTSFWARWNCPELKFMKQDEKNELWMKKKTKKFGKFHFLHHARLGLTFWYHRDFKSL